MTLKALLHYALSHRRFYFTSRFSLVSKTREKTREKREKNARKINNASPTRDNVSILHYALGKNGSQLRFGCVLVAFWLRFGCVLVAFWLRFGCVLVAFWLRFGRVLVTNIAKTQTQCIV